MTAPKSRPRFPKRAGNYEEAEAILHAWHLNSAATRNWTASMYGFMVWRIKVEPVVIAALRLYAKGQRERGWPAFADPVVRVAAKLRTLHRERLLPPEVRRTIAYQAYWTSLPDRERAVAKAAGNGIDRLPPQRIER